MCRGNCYTRKAGNIGLVLRRAVAQGIRVMGDDDMDVCCSGADAPQKVRDCRMLLLCGTPRELCC